MACKKFKQIRVGDEIYVYYGGQFFEYTVNAVNLYDPETSKMVLSASPNVPNNLGRINNEFTKEAVENHSFQVHEPHNYYVTPSKLRCRQVISSYREEMEAYLDRLDTFQRLLAVERRNDEQ